MRNPTGYYVYAYLDTRKPGRFTYPIGSFLLEPFYIGKGYGKRQFKHLADQRPSLKTTRIADIIADTGQPPVIIKLATNLTEMRAFEMERAWITSIGRVSKGEGPLTNLTSGGQGPSGLVLSEDSRRKIREKLKGRALPESVKAKMRGRKTWNKGIPQTEEVKAKLSATLKGRSITERQRECLRLGVESTRGRKLSPEQYERAKATMFKKGQPSAKKGVPWAEEQKKKLAETRAQKPISEETRTKMRLAKAGKPSNRKGKKASAETRERLRLSHLGKKRDESACRKTSESLKAFYALRREE